MEAIVVRQARTAGVPGPGAALIAICGPDAARRLRGVLASGRSLGVAAVLLGLWPPGTTCQVAADGVVTAVTPPDTSLDGIRLFNLGAAEAAAIAAVLRDAHGDPPAGPVPAPPVSDGHPAEVPARPQPAGNHYLPASAPAGSPGPAPASATSPAAPAPASPAPEASTPSVGAGEPPARDARPVHLSMLGPLRITAAGQEIGGGLRKARELMAFLAVHPDGASGEAISEALWPESEPGHATAQRNLALHKARDMLRTATGLPAPMWILHTSGRYRLDPGLISTGPVAVLRRPGRGPACHRERRPAGRLPGSSRALPRRAGRGSRV
jgi:hypothetical protein